MGFTTRPTLRGSFGMVASTHWIASSCGMAVLERGGNAFDAAVAAGFVLHLVEPHLNGPGGDLPALIKRGQDDTPRVLCAQGPAPREATVEAFRNLGLAEIPGSGPAAAAVPGAVDGWLLLLRDHGTWALEDVLEAAIGYARHGAPLVPRVGDTVATVQQLFVEDWPSSAQLWLPGGAPPRANELHAYPAYADCLERLVAESQAGVSREDGIERARRAWSQGFVAEALDRWAAHGPIHCPGGNQPYLVTGADLAAYTAHWEPPAMVDAFGVRVAKTGAWGQGPVLLQALQILEATAGLADLDLDAETGVHLTLEALKLALADRDAWYGDSADVPLDTLLSPEYAAVRAALITDTASHELRPGSPDGRTARWPGVVTAPPPPVADLGTGEPTLDPTGRTRGDTCHIDVVDRWGNLISATPSGGWLQSSPVIPELGFPLGSRLQMFWLDEGLPSSLVPGRRPRTTLSPTLVLHENGQTMACGTPGGDQQDQWQLNFLLRVLRGESLQQAIDAASFHTLSMIGSFAPRRIEPGVSVVEDRMSPQVRSGLARRGHDLRQSGAWTLGRLSAVTWDPRTRIVTAAANPRDMQGYAVGR
jgi:gamma-glutamyltranspeptidase/glutathione hydrolase